MPGSVRSIGSSSVITIRSGVLSRLSKAWAVVVLPDPGGPATAPGRTSAPARRRASPPLSAASRARAAAEGAPRRRRSAARRAPRAPSGSRCSGGPAAPADVRPRDGSGLRHLPLGGGEARHRLQPAPFYFPSQRARDRTSVRARTRASPPRRVRVRARQRRGSSSARTNRSATCSPCTVGITVHRRLALLTADEHGDGSGLRQPPLGGDEARHRLQTARHRPLQLLRDAPPLAHDAVHADADDEGVVLGIEVDVGRAVVDGVFDGEGDQLVEIGGRIGDMEGGGLHRLLYRITLRRR